MIPDAEIAQLVDDMCTSHGWEGLVRRDEGREDDEGGDAVSLAESAGTQESEDFEVSNTFVSVSVSVSVSRG